MIQIDCSNNYCTIVLHGSRSTLLGWQPTFDKDGHPLNHNPNIITSSYSCQKCGRTWIMKEDEMDAEVIETTTDEMRST
jgi:hypothetical protein